MAITDDAELKLDELNEDELAKEEFDIELVEVEFALEEEGDELKDALELLDDLLEETELKKDDIDSELELPIITLDDELDLWEELLPWLLDDTMLATELLLNENATEETLEDDDNEEIVDDWLLTATDELVVLVSPPPLAPHPDKTIANIHTQIGDFTEKNEYRISSPQMLTHQVWNLSGKSSSEENAIRRIWSQTSRIF